MPRLGDSYDAMTRALGDHFGPPLPPLIVAGERPGPSLALVVAAFLAGQNQDRGLNTVLGSLAEAGLLADPEALATADPAEIAAAWTHTNKPPSVRTLRTLQRIAAWIAQLGGFDALESIPTEALREGLRSLNGVGPAGADAILLHALKRPAYPVDRATYRILLRHGWIDSSADYDEARGRVENLASGESTALADLSGWFERVGAVFCRATVAKCERCPLRPFLPDGGPIEPDLG
jgi:endonuclease-3 related protein